uniref:Uncharacterized protein n=1 Tax=Escherichia coli TaxID=562 RepID=A0A2H4NF86_ECOLX|nr:hypothetical protein [Escherichia coli]
MLIVALRLNPSTRKIQACNSNCAAGLIISPRIIIHIPNLVLVGVYLLKPTKRRTIKVCPRTVRMYANAQISGVFPDIVRTGSEVHFCRCPDTGLALASVPIRCVEKRRSIGKVSSYQLNFPYSQSNLGQHTFCALSHVRATGFHNSNDYSECSLSKSGSNWQLTAYPPSIASYRCDAVCID